MLHITGSPGGGWKAPWASLQVTMNRLNCAGSLAALPDIQRDPKRLKKMNRQKPIDKVQQGQMQRHILGISQPHATVLGGHQLASKKLCRKGSGNAAGKVENDTAVCPCGNEHYLCIMLRLQKRSQQIKRSATSDLPGICWTTLRPVLCSQYLAKLFNERSNTCFKLPSECLVGKVEPDSSQGCTTRLVATDVSCSKKMVLSELSKKILHAEGGQTLE